MEYNIHNTLPVESGESPKDIKKSNSDSEVINRAFISKDGPINMAITEETTAYNLISYMFGKMYDSTSYYLYMEPFDTEVLINNTIFEATDFKSFVDNLQSKYNIYANGVNVFADGNIIYVLGRSTCDTTDVRSGNGWTYRLSVIDDIKQDMKGHYPIHVDQDNREILSYVPSSAITYTNYTVDGDISGKIFAMDGSTGEIVGESEGTKTTMSKIVTTSTPNVKVKPKEENEDVVKELSSILLMNTVLTFVPNDVIIIEDSTRSEFKWKGIIKRWSAITAGAVRTMYLIALGKIDPSDSIKGNEGSKLEALSALSNLNSDMMKDTVSNVAGTIKGDIHNIKDELKNVLGKPSELITKARNKFDATFDDATKTIQYYGDSLGKQLMNTLGDVVNSDEVFKNIVDTSNAIYTIPGVKEWVDKGVSKIGTELGLRIDQMVNGYEDTEYTEGYDELFTYDDLLSRAGDLSDEDIKDNFLLYGDGLDDIINSRLIKEMIENQDNGFIADLLKGFDATDRAILYDIYLSERVENTMIRKEEYPDLYVFYDKVRMKYKYTMNMRGTLDSVDIPNYVDIDKSGTTITVGEIKFTKEEYNNKIKDIVERIKEINKNFDKDKEVNNE